MKHSMTSDIDDILFIVLIIMIIDREISFWISEIFKIIILHENVNFRAKFSQIKR
jgi:hypothetical protein